MSPVVDRNRCRLGSRSRRADGPGPLRRGLAPLEFVLVYPTFVALLCCCMWIAIFFLRKADVTIAARYAVDAQRQSAGGTPGAEPFEFDGSDDARTADSKSADVRFSDFMPTGRVTSRYSVLAGTWDHQVLPMDVAPDVELAARLAGLGPVSSLSGELADLMAAMREIEDMTDSLGGLLGLNQSNFFSEFVSAVGEIEPADLGGLAGLAPAGDTAALGDAVTRAAASLGDQVGPVSEIADIYRRLVGESGNALREVTERSEKAGEAARQMESNTSGASTAFEGSEAAVERLDEVLDDPQSTPDQKAAAIAAARNQIGSSFADASASLDDGTEKDRADANRLVKETFRRKFADRIPDDLSSLEGLAEEVDRDGLQALSRKADSLLEQLSTAVTEEDTEEAEELREALDFLTDAARETLRDAAAAATEIRAKTEEAGRRTSGLGEAAMPRIE